MAENQTDIIQRLDGYAEIPDMDQRCQGDIAEAKREITTLRSRLEECKGQIEMLLDAGTKAASDLERIGEFHTFGACRRPSAPKTFGPCFTR